MSSILCVVGQTCFTRDGDVVDALAWSELVAYVRQNHVGEVMYLKFVVADASVLPSRDVVARIAAALTSRICVELAMHAGQLANIPNLAQALQNLAPIVARAHELYICTIFLGGPGEPFDAANALEALSETPSHDGPAIDESLLKKVQLFVPGVLMTPLLKLLVRRPAQLTELLLVAEGARGVPCDVVLPNVLTESSKLTASAVLLKGLKGVRQPLAEVVVVATWAGAAAQDNTGPIATVPIDCLGGRTRLRTRVPLRMPAEAPRIAELRAEVDGVHDLAGSARWRVGRLDAAMHHGTAAYCDCLALLLHQHDARFDVREAPNLLVVRLNWEHGPLIDAWRRNKCSDVVRKLAEWYPQALAFQVTGPLRSRHPSENVHTVLRNGRLPPDLKTMVALVVALAAAAGLDPGPVRQAVYTVLLAVDVSSVRGLLALKMALIRPIVHSMAGRFKGIAWKAT